MTAKKLYLDIYGANLRTLEFRLADLAYPWLSSRRVDETVSSHRDVRRRRFHGTAHLYLILW